MTTQAIILDIDGTLLNDDKKNFTRNQKSTHHRATEWC